MKILVTEIQHYAAGNVSAPTYAFDDENAANAKYHQILASAAVSSLPVHSAVMYTEDGFWLKGECFKHIPAQDA